MKKMTWTELSDYLQNNHNEIGYVVFKQNPTWNREFSEEDRTYIVEGNNKFFYDNMISSSIWSSNLTGTDKGVRLDHYMFYEKEPARWEIDYCYILEN